MSVLITGVAGFIGSNFARYLAEQEPGLELVGVDNLSPYSCRANIQDLEESEKLSLHVGDIAELDEMEALFRDRSVEVVVNFAAESHNDRAILDPTSFARSNALGAQSLLEASRRVGVRRHIHISTIEVYGEQAPDVAWFEESSPLNAKTPYSAAKAAGDMFVRAYMQTYRDMDICMTHCANNYGPYQLPEKLIPLSVTNLLRGKKVPIYGDGLQARDWLHVEDHCHAIKLIMDHEGPFEFGGDAANHPERLPIFDISARQEVPNIDIVQLILDELSMKWEDCVEQVADRPNHDRKYLINPAKIERELGFESRIPFEQGIRDTVRWYVDNEAWWKPILEGKQLLVDWKNVDVPGLRRQ